MEDTIAAISTAIGEGAIAIVRMSGPRAFAVADAIFESKKGTPSSFPTHTIHLGRICANGNSVDQVMLTVMRASNTYTTEDVVEINCHGGPLTARSILGLCVQHGARLAEPGEFTKRAFLNGRLDLTQAEAVMDLITAKTTRAHMAAESALEGHLSKRIQEAREQILNIVAHIEAHIDFPEDDIDAGTRYQWLNQTQAVVVLLRELLATARDGKVLRQGIAVTIIGRPNVGKSSLMNALLGEDRAIVTPIPGTTRDTIEEVASINGIPVRLTDTAGIRKARGSIEAIGINRSRNSLELSDLVLHVLDGSRRFSAEDRRLIALCENRQMIQVINKADLPQRLFIPPDSSHQTQVAVSAANGDGLSNLRNMIESIALSGSGSSRILDVVVNERQADALRRAIKYLTESLNEFDHGASGEIISQQMRLGLDAIGEIVGSTTTEDILKRIFSTFCIGK